MIVTHVIADLSVVSVGTCTVELVLGLVYEVRPAGTVV